MQQFPSSDSLGALISICTSKEDELQAMLEAGLEKKRRLSSSQVRALEKHFAAEKKVEPERKARLAAELGLQPRQVAVWFQNRRARWKNNQLHRDFAALRADYDSLKRDFKALQQEKEVLSIKVRELKEKLNVGDSHSREIDKDPQSSPMMTFENMGGSSSSSVMNWFQMPDLRMITMEEQSLLRSEESCNVNIYSVDQPPTLHCLLLRPLQDTSKQ